MHPFQDNLAALEVKLNADQLQLLDRTSAVPMGFPHDFYEGAMVRNFVYGGMRDKIIG
jgi:hypothetical protein